MIRVWDAGISGPPHSPWNTRNTTSMVRDEAMPHSMENTAKPIMENRKVRTTPKRVTSQPESGTVKASATA